MLNDIAEDQKTREKEKGEIYREKERDLKSQQANTRGRRRG